MLLLVPRDPLAPRRAEPHFAVGQVGDRPAPTPPADLVAALAGAAA
ncbi:hypothetical protein [Blastococcus sp. SYSU D00820]